MSMVCISFFSLACRSPSVTELWRGRESRQRGGEKGMEGSTERNMERNTSSVQVHVYVYITSVHVHVHVHGASTPESRSCMCRVH